MNAALPPGATLLSPVEHLFTGAGSYPITFAFKYSTRLDAGLLSESLARALAIFPWVGSTLERHSPTDLAFVPRSSPPPLELLPKAPVWDGARYDHDYLQPIQSLPGLPVARCRLSHTPTGSVLAVSLSHALADGFSYFHFVTSWARLSRGLAPVMPVRQDVTTLPAADGALTPEGVREATGFTWAQQRGAHGDQPARQARLMYPRTQLTALVAEARQSSTRQLTTNDVLTACLWREAAARQHFADNVRASVSCPVDGRTLVKACPPTQFGCVIMMATADAEAGWLREAPLGAVAQRVRETVSAVDPLRLARSMGTLQALRQTHGLAVLESLHVRAPNHGLIVTNLTRMPLAELDFGAGVPEAYLAASDETQGAALFAKEDGVEAHLYLHAVD